MKCNVVLSGDGVASASVVRGEPARIRSQAGGRSMRQGWLARVGCTLLGVSWLAAISLTAVDLLADDPPLAAQPADQPRKPANQPESKETPPDSDKAAQPAAHQELLPPPKPSPGKQTTLPVVFRKDTPSSLDELKSFESHVKNLLARVSPSVVSVEVGGGVGSGVVISENGLVLCAAHVCGTTNRPVIFTFPDGKTARGKTLGTNHDLDAGLMVITNKGSWPHVDIGDLDKADLGDWVLALGHPGGFDPQRSIVVRLGRIIRLASFAVQTDCTLIGGDSGGPLFDMHGRVVGIHSRISDSTAENFHVPIAGFQDTWDRLARSENWGGRESALPPWVGAWGLDHPNGFRVELVHKNGPCERAGLKVGDVVRQVNGHAVKDYASFVKFVSQTKPGDEITLEIKRDDEDMTLKVTVEPNLRGGGGRSGP